MYLKWSFLLLPTVLNRHFQLYSTTQHARHQKYKKIAWNCHPQIFDFYIKKRVLTNLFAQFHSTVLFSISFCLYRACFTHLISSNLSYGTIYVQYYDQFVHFDKEINANVYRHSLWEYSRLDCKQSLIFLCKVTARET